MVSQKASNILPFIVGYITWIHPRIVWVKTHVPGFQEMPGPPQMDHPISYPGANTNYPGPIQLSLRAHLKKVPIRLNSYEKILSLIGMDQG